MRARFGVVCRIGFYTAPELKQIVVRSAGILGIAVDDDAALEIAQRSRGPHASPTASSGGSATSPRSRPRAGQPGDCRHGLEALEVDERGLDDMDKRILLTIMDKFAGGPVGIGTLATAVGEDEDTIEEVYEPYLVTGGFLERTPRGREITDLARRHFGRMRPPTRTGYCDTC